jgi:hypothetical protein
MPSLDVLVCPAAGGRGLVRTTLGVLAYAALVLLLYSPGVLRF